jgi:hypothetical protein
MWQEARSRPCFASLPSARCTVDLHSWTRGLVDQATDVGHAFTLSGFRDFGISGFQEWKNKVAFSRRASHVTRHMAAVLDLV